MALPLPSNLGALWHVLLHLVVFLQMCSSKCSAVKCAVEPLQSNMQWSHCSAISFFIFVQVAYYCFCKANGCNGGR